MDNTFIRVNIIIIICVLVFKVNGYTVEKAKDRGVNTITCNSADLRNWTENDCWCLGDNATMCILQTNGGMEWNLNIMKLHNYTKMEYMVFVLNNSWMGHFPVIEQYPLDLRSLKEFTELRDLRITPSVYQTHSVPLLFHRSTFTGCHKIEELHINIPVQDTDQLYWMIQPLTKLRVLNFNNLRGISYRNMNKTMKGLTRNIEKVWLSHFQTIGQTEYLTVFITHQFFVGTFEKLVEVDLSNNGFALIYTGWFKSTPNLLYLDMSHNGLTFSTNTPFLIETLMHPSIQVLNMSHQGSYDPLNRNTNMRFLYAPANLKDTQKETQKPNEKFGVISHEIITCLNKVTHGNISNLFGNDTTTFCAALRNCTFPSWKYFSCDYLPTLNELIDSDCEMWLKIPLGGNMTEFYYANNFLDPISHTGIVLHGTICFTENKLRKVDFSNNYFWANSAKIAESVSRITQVVGLRNIKELNVDQNDFVLNMTAAAVNFPYLTTLQMSKNFAQIPAGVSLCRDKGIHSLIELDLSQNNLTLKETWQVIENCANLSRLNLAGNNIDSSLFISLVGAKNLSYIDLSSNNIETLNTRFLSELDGLQNLTINISNNPLTCVCSDASLAFIKWVADHSRKITIADIDKLLCVGSHGLRSLQSVDYMALWRECRNIVPIVASVVSSLGVVLAALLITLIVHMRFRIKYKLFIFDQWLKRIFATEQDQETNQTPYVYDAFVSYSSEDRFWVHDVLMKTLEEKYGFKLVIHYRDFPLGRNVQNAIDDGLTKSREFILVVTKNFLESYWCKTEMEEAYRESLRRHSHLAVIVLGEVPTEINNPTANRILDQHNYLQWKLKEQESDSTHRRKLFWTKLVHHLYGNADTCCSCCCAFRPRDLHSSDVRDFTENESDPLIQVASQQYGSVSNSVER